MVGLAIMLKEKNYNVTVVTYHNIDFYKKQLDDADVRNLVIPMVVIKRSVFGPCVHS